MSKFFSKLIWLTSIVLILFVLLISLVKVSLPYWAKQKDSIVGYVESYIGGELDYQSLQINWSEFHPVVEIEGLSWQMGDESLLVKSQYNKIKLDLWRTLYHGELVTKDIELKDLLVKSIANNSLNQKKFDLHQFKQTVKSASKKFQHQYISVVDLQLEVTDGTNSENISKQSIPQLIFKQDKQEKQLFLDTYGELIEKGRFVVESKGELFSDSLRVNYYFNFNGINLKQLSEQFNIANISDYNFINSEAWFSQHGEHIKDARVELSNDSSDLAKIDIVINLSSENGIYQVNSERFDISIKEEDGYIDHRSFLNLSNKNDSQYHIRTGIVPIAFLNNMLLPALDGGLSNYSMHLQPKGLIKSIDLIIRNSAQGLVAEEGNIEVENFSVSPYQQIPGIEFDEVLINGSNGHWDLSATAQSKNIDWRPMLKSIRDVEQLTIDAHWDGNNSSEIQLNNFYFKNSDAEVKARANLQLSEEFSMAIYAEAEAINIANLHYYWPRNPGLSPRALEYLDQSLISGEVPFAKFIWQGSVAGFPFKDKSGQFDIQASTRNARFKFQPDWPVASNLNAVASFENATLKIKARSGELLGVKVIGATALIPDLKAADERLLIDIQAVSNYDSYQKVYKQSPLIELLGTELLDISFADSLDVDLSLDFLLAKETQAKVKGTIDFSGNQIIGIPYNIRLDNAHGQLRFTDEGAITKNFVADVFGSKMGIELKVDKFTDDGSFVQIDANGLLNIGNVADQLLGHNLLQVTGESDFYIHYKIDQETGGNESLIVRSDLLGSAISGPAWLEKNSIETSSLLVTLFKNDNEIKLRSSYSDQFSTQLTFDSSNERKPNGLIKLGSIATQNLEYPKEGVAIEGYFDEVVVHEWLDALQFKKSSEESTQWPNWIERINVTTPSLKFAGQEFTNVRINDVKTTANLEQDVRFNLFSEQARANVTYLKNGQKQLVIEHLSLNLKSDEDKVDDAFELDLTEYDNWMFECRDCEINGFQFGPVKLTSNYLDNQIQIKGTAFVSNQLTSNISGVIDQDKTQIALDFDVPNPAGLLQHWELAGEIPDSKASGELNLQWPGRLHDFSLKNTDGEFKVGTGNGSIKDLSDRKARIFSLFSLQSIPRRLALDFTDIFRDGFFYDKIVGNFKIQKGVLNSEKVEVKGTAADVVVNGSVDLNTQTVNQQVIVTPKLSSSLPVLAGWAIEPTTGLIMLIVSKIFEPALNVVSSIEYKITGALEEPEVIEVSKKSKEVEVTEEQIDAQKKELLIEDDEEHPINDSPEKSK